MNKKVKKEWVKALTSNKFYQTTEQLADHNRGRDVLGVLAQVQGTSVAVLRANSNITDISKGLRAGLSKRSEEFLIKKNDLAGWTFKQFAKYINKHY